MDKTFGEPEVSENEELKYDSELYYRGEIDDVKLKNSSIRGIMDLILADVQSIGCKAKDIVDDVNKVCAI